MPSKYAPAREDGLKPYVVTVWDFGHERDALVWANDASGARWQALGRRSPTRYAKHTRRATPEDLTEGS